MRDYLEGELDPAEGVGRRCKSSPSVLSCIGKRKKEGCDRGSGRVGEGPVPLRKPKKPGRKDNCKKDLISW